MPNLFDPVAIGDFRLPNRIVMAPLTRNRAHGAERVPTDLTRDYYVQRASAGLIVTEATSVEPRGVGYPHTPGIWSEEQAAAWKVVTDAVHAAGGRILSQLWHVGRISDPEYHGGERPVAPSAIAAAGDVSLLRPKRPYSTPRALETDEVRGIVEAFRRGAENAKLAGFDGVEIHGANGYLLDQFLQDGSNKRTDRYGGSLENRARLLLEVADVAISVWGAGKVGVHIAPRGDAHDMGDSDLAKTFGYVAEHLGKRRIAFLFARESQKAPRLGPGLKKIFGGAYIANEGLDAAAGQALLDAGEADAIAFGKDFIANPDLVRRLHEKAPLNSWNASTFYSEGPRGYTDYPALETVEA